jgi:hypothetical protein
LTGLGASRAKQSTAVVLCPSIMSSFVVVRWKRRRVPWRRPLCPRARSIRIRWLPWSVRVWVLWSWPGGRKSYSTQRESKTPHHAPSRPPSALQCHPQVILRCLLHALVRDGGENAMAGDIDVAQHHGNENRMTYRTQS